MRRRSGRSPAGGTGDVGGAAQVAGGPGSSQTALGGRPDQATGSEAQVAGEPERFGCLRTERVRVPELLDAKRGAESARLGAPAPD